MLRPPDSAGKVRETNVTRASESNPPPSKRAAGFPLSGWAKPECGFSKGSMKHVGKLLLGAIVLGVLFFLVSIDGTFCTVNLSDRAALLRFDRAIGIEDLGLHFKLPFIEKIVTISVREQKEEFKTQAYSQDQQPATVLPGGAVPFVQGPK
jgi:hypothetical protein